MFDFSIPGIFDKINRIMKMCDSKDFQPKVDTTPEWLKEIHKEQERLTSYERSHLTA